MIFKCGCEYPIEDLQRKKFAATFCPKHNKELDKLKIFCIEKNCNNTRVIHKLASRIKRCKTCQARHKQHFTNTYRSRIKNYDPQAHADMTHKEIAENMGISTQRVQQLETSAIKKVIKLLPEYPLLKEIGEEMQNAAIASRNYYERNLT